MLSRNNHEMIISQSMPLIILLQEDRKIFEKIYEWLTTSFFAFKLEGYAFNIYV